MDDKLLEILVCPQNHVPLDVAEPSLLAQLNRAIAAGQVKNQAGRALVDGLHGGLVRRDRAVLYPIVDGIPLLLVEEAIPLDQIKRCVS